MPRRDRSPEAPRGSGDGPEPGDADESSKNLEAVLGGRQCSLDRFNLVEPTPDTQSRVALFTFSHSDSLGFWKRPSGTTKVPHLPPPRRLIGRRPGGGPPVRNLGICRLFWGETGRVRASFGEIYTVGERLLRRAGATQGRPAAPHTPPVDSSGAGKPAGRRSPSLPPLPPRPPHLSSRYD